jgi:hypothetical protein
MKNLLEPWVVFRLVAGLLACVLLLRAAWTSVRVLRRFDVARATEGQLALERQAELAATFVRVATVVQVGALALSVLAADKLSHGVRGAMCAYGVFAAHPLGFESLGVTLASALACGILAQSYAFDARVRGMDLVRPLAIATLVIAPLGVLDLVMCAKYMLGLDLSVVASCCSVELDAEGAGNVGYAAGPRVLATFGALVSVAVSIGAALLAARRPGRSAVTLAAAAAAIAFPFAVAASVLEVAPFAFEVPQHVCPFCLLRADVYGIGYILFGAIFLAFVWGVGAGMSALLARGAAARQALPRFAKERLERTAVAWGVALAVGALPVVRYAIVSGGGSLFP